MSMTTPYQFLGAHKVRSINTKVHVLNYPENSLKLKRDLKKVLRFLRRMTPPQDCRYAFVIVHREEDELFVTSGRWSTSLKTCLATEEGYASDEENDVDIRESYDGTQHFYPCEMRIIAMENHAWSKYMMREPKRPDDYMNSQWKNSTV